MDKKYHIDNRYLVRNAMLSIEDYKSIFLSENENNVDRLLWNRIKDDNVFLESIRLASYDVYNALNNAKESEEPNYKLLQTMFKYYVRMCGRATPFGIFSGVGEGVICSAGEDSILNYEKAKKYVNVNMEWLHGYRSLLENDDTKLVKIRVKNNDVCYVKGDRLINPYQTEKGKSYFSSIRYSNLLKIVLEECKQFIMVEELVNKIVNRRFTSDAQKALQYIKELLNNHYLISELMPPLVNDNQLSYFIEILKKYNLKNDVKYLLEISHMIEEYQNKKLGEGIESLDAITRSMADKYKEKNYLNVNLKSQFLINQLNIEFIQELGENFSKLFQHFWNAEEIPSLKRIKKVFLEKYGYNTEIPILEFLDPNNFYDGMEEFLDSNIIETQKKSIINILFANKFSNYEKEFIEITDEDLQRIKINEDMSDFPDTFEMMVEIYKNPQNSMLIAEYAGIGTGFSGRFAEMLPSICEQKAYVKNIINKNSDEVLVELTEEMQVDRANNIVINKTMADFQLVGYANATQNIPCLLYGDIYIGIDKNKKFYFKSLSLGKRIKIQTNHMLNYKAGSRVYKFLRKISEIEINNLRKIFYEFESCSVAYKPAIIYKNIILRPRIWHIDKKSSNDEIYKFCRRYKVPNLIYMFSGDNKLVINLADKTSIDVLVSYLKKSENGLFLKEFKVDEKDYLIRDTEGKHYSSEYVFTFYKQSIRIHENKSELLMTQSDYLKNRIFSWKTKCKRELFFENEWIYFKLFIDSTRINQFLGEELLFFSERKKFEERGVKHFFIRYYDEGKHVRFRVKCSLEKDMFNVLSEILEWLSTLKERNIISKASIETYEREIERYGGEKAIEYAETYFCSESHIIEKILFMVQEGECKNTLDEIGIIVLISMLNEWGLDRNKAEIWLSDRVQKNELRSEFKKNSKAYIRLCQQIYENRLIENFYKEIMRELRKYINQINILDQNGLLTNSKSNILESIFHMFCNRIVGNNYWERKIYIMARHSVYAYNQYEKSLKRYKENDKKSI